MSTRTGKLGYLVLAALLAQIAISSSAEARPARDDKQVPKSPFVLHVRADHVIGRYKQPVYIHPFLKNVIHKDEYIWYWFNPVPFGHGAHLKSLKMKCYRLKTGKEVEYLYPISNGMTMAEGRRKELPDRVLPGRSTGNGFDLASFCILTPGDHILILQYDTTEIAGWIKPDDRAWHGITNQVRVRVHINRSSRKSRSRSPNTHENNIVPPLTLRVPINDPPPCGGARSVESQAT